MKNVYKAKIEKYRDKPLDYNDKCLWAYVTIWLNCGNGHRVNIKFVEDSDEMWNTLKRWYKALDLAIRDQVVFQMIFFIQSDFKTIAEYSESIKQREVKCTKMRNPVASWLQSFFFQLDLNFDPK